MASTKRNVAQRLRAGEEIIGFKFTQPGVVAAEQVALLGYDFIFLDMQHGSMSIGEMTSTMVAITAGGSASFVRVASHDPAEIGKALDAGAEAVMVPMVSTASQARAIVDCCKYPPVGTRSYGPLRARVIVGASPKVANERVMTMVMIETREAIENVEEIASIPGVDVIYVGLSDLTVEFGYEPRAQEAEAEIDAAMKRILAAARRAKIVAGVACTTGAQGRKYLSEGFQLVCVSGDINAIVSTARSSLDAARGN